MFFEKSESKLVETREINLKHREKLSLKRLEGFNIVKKRPNLGVAVTQDPYLENGGFNKFLSMTTSNFPKNKLFQKSLIKGFGYFQCKPISRKIFQWLFPTSRQIQPHNISQFYRKRSRKFQGIIFNMFKSIKRNFQIYIRWTFKGYSSLNNIVLNNLVFRSKN